MQSLADFLDVPDPRPEDKRPNTEYEALLNTSDPKDFCQKILESREFRQYIMNGITLGDLPPAVMCRVIDHAWGKPAERVEHTGKDGAPIITEVRRVIVRAENQEEELAPAPRREVTH